MSKISYAVLSAMPSVIDFSSDKIRAAGWYGHTRGRHTFAITVHNFQGRIALQGSQALDPQDSDWFALPCPAPYDLVPYIQYPRAPPSSPFGVGLQSPGDPAAWYPPSRYPGESSTIGFSLLINCLWLRASVTRAYLLPVGLPLYASSVSDAISWLGAVDSILVNF